MPRLRWVRSVGLLSFPLLILMGCSSSNSKEVVVSGVVKFNGEPLPGGTITFISVNEKDKVATAGINEDGTYSIGKAPVGDVKVTIIGPSRPSDKSKGTKPPLTIPKTYEKAESSKLTYTVTTESKQTKDFDLK